MREWMRVFASGASAFASGASVCMRRSAIAECKHDVPCSWETIYVPLAVPP